MENKSPKNTLPTTNAKSSNKSQNATGFSIDIIDATGEVFGTQNISVSADENISFTMQGQTSPVAVVNTKEKTFTFTAGTHTQTVEISKISMDYAENLTFTVDTDKERITYKIDGNSISQRKTGERQFTTIAAFDKPLDVSLPKNLPAQIASKSISVKSFPSQMFETFKNQYGYSAFELKAKKLQLLKAPNGNVLVVKGKKIVPVENSHYINKGDSAVLGLITTKTKGVVNRTSTSGVGFKLTTEEIVSVAEFIEGKRVDNSIFVSNADEQILDFNVAPKTSAVTKKASSLNAEKSSGNTDIVNKGPQSSIAGALPSGKAPETIEESEPKKPQQPSPNIEAPQIKKPEQPVQEAPKPETKDKKPEEKKEEKKPEEKKDKDAKKEEKKTDIQVGAISFLIAAITFGLLIAGIGGIITAILCGASTFLAATNATSITIKYAERERGEKPNKKKQKKNKKANKNKDKNIDKNKTQELQQQQQQQQQQQTPSIATHAPIEESKRTESQTIAKLDIDEEKYKQLKTAIEKEKQLRSNPELADEHQKALDELVSIAKSINPSNAHVSLFSKEDQPLAQICNDIITASIATSVAMAEKQEAEENLTEARESLSKKPNSKKAKVAAAATQKESEYSQSASDKIIETFNSTIDNLEDLVSSRLSTEQKQEETTSPAQTYNPETKQAVPVATSSTTTPQETESTEPSDTIIDLKNKFDSIVENTGNNTKQDYFEVIKLSQKAYAELDSRTELTDQETNIKNLCQKLIELEETRSSQESDITEWKTELESLDSTEEGKDEARIKELKDKIDAISDEHIDITQATKEALHNLGNSAKAMIDGTTYIKPKEDESTAENTTQDDKGQEK